MVAAAKSRVTGLMSPSSASLPITGKPKTPFSRVKTQHRPRGDSQEGDTKETFFRIQLLLALMVWPPPPPVPSSRKEDENGTTYYYGLRERTTTSQALEGKKWDRGEGNFYYLTEASRQARWKEEVGEGGGASQSVRLPRTQYARLPADCVKVRIRRTRGTRPLHPSLPRSFINGEGAMEWWLLAKVFHRQILGFQKVSNFITMDSPHSKHSTQIVLKSFLSNYCWDATGGLSFFVTVLFPPHTSRSNHARSRKGEGGRRMP